MIFFFGHFLKKDEARLQTEVPHLERQRSQRGRLSNEPPAALGRPVERRPPKGPAVPATTPRHPQAHLGEGVHRRRLSLPQPVPTAPPFEFQRPLRLRMRPPPPPRAGGEWRERCPISTLPAPLPPLPCVRRLGPAAMLALPTLPRRLPSASLCLSPE